MSSSSDERLKKEPSRDIGQASVPHTPQAERAEGDVGSRLGLELPRSAGAWWVGQVHCPFCLALVETTLVGISTLLGPSLLQCRKCGRPFVSHRREWRDRGALGRAWYVGVSLGYVLICAGLAFLVTLVACALARVPIGWFPACGAALWGTAVIVLQVWRVARSARRTRSSERIAHRPTFWSLDFFLPQKVLLGMILSAGVLAWLARLAAAR
jgi:hypothetical protein